MRLENKVAIVTGANSGIGAAVARLFAGEGASVAIVGRRVDKSEEVAREISAAGGSALAVGADITKSDDVMGMVETTVAAFGGLDILVNNAGCYHDNLVVDVEEDEWDLVVDTNLKGTFLGCKYAIPAMLVRGGGAIVNTTAAAGILGNARRSAYCAAKGGIIAFTRSIANEYARQNIRVNCLAPHAATPMLEHMLEHKEPAYRQKYLDHMPTGRLATTDEAARAFLFLASDDAATVTGACLQADGGFSSFTYLHRL